MNVIAQLEFELALMLPYLDVDVTLQPVIHYTTETPSYHEGVTKPRTGASKAVWRIKPCYGNYSNSPGAKLYNSLTFSRTMLMLWRGETYSTANCWCSIHHSPGSFQDPGGLLRLMDVIKNKYHKLLHTSWSFKHEKISTKLGINLYEGGGG